MRWMKCPNPRFPNKGLPTEVVGPLDEPAASETKTQEGLVEPEPDSSQPKPVPQPLRYRARTR